MDPWGTETIFDSGVIWLNHRSAGPDRIHGTGDDIDIFAVSTALGLRGPGPMPAWVTFVCRGPELLTLAAITLVWCLVAPFRRSVRAPLAREPFCFLAALAWRLRSTAADRTTTSPESPGAPAPP